MESRESRTETFSKLKEDIVSCAIQDVFNRANLDEQGEALEYNNFLKSIMSVDEKHKPSMFTDRRFSVVFSVVEKNIKEKYMKECGDNLTAFSKEYYGYLEQMKNNQKEFDDTVKYIEDKINGLNPIANSDEVSIVFILLMRKKEYEEIIKLPSIKEALKKKIKVILNREGYRDEFYHLFLKFSETFLTDDEEFMSYIKSLAVTLKGNGKGKGKSKSSE